MKIATLLALSFLLSRAIAAQTSAGTGVQVQQENKKPHVRLKPGKPIEKELAGGATDTYEIRMKKGQFLHVVAEQKGIDVVLMLIGPIGKVLVEADSPNGEHGPEPVSAIAERSGDHKLLVYASQKDAVPGRYEVRITAIRQPQPDDRKRLTAEQEFHDGIQLTAQPSPEKVQKALEKLEGVLPLWRQLGDRYEESLTLNTMGTIYTFLGDLQKALANFSQALELRNGVGDHFGEAETLTNIGVVYADLGQTKKAIEYFAKVLPVHHDLGNRRAEATTLSNLADCYSRLGEKPKALEYDTQAIELQRAIGDRAGEADTLNDIGMFHSELGEKQKALDYFTQALALRRQVGDRAGEATTLNSIGGLYSDLGENQRALEYYEQALALRRAVGDRSGEAITLQNIGTVYKAWGKEQEALDFFGQALELERAVRDRQDEGVTLQNIGSVYDDLGAPREALDKYSQALAIHREVGDRSNEALALSNMGLAYFFLGEKQKALDCFSAALPLERQIGDRAVEAATLHNMAGVYAELGQRDKALEYLSQALPIRREVGDRIGESATLNTMGKTYLELGRKQESLEALTQALLLSREVQEPLYEGSVLDNLMRYWRAEKRPDLAIVFGKEAVNLYQQIRRNISSEKKETQKGFLSSKESTYKELADLLIGQGRLPEAEQVLDLLKDEEYSEFVRGGNAMEAKSQPVTLNPEEQASHEAYEKIASQITALGVEYSELRAKSTRTPEEEARFGELKDKLTLANQEMGRFFKTLYVEFGKNTQANQSAETVREETSGMQSIVRELGSGTVAMYTLVGETHYSVIVITASTMQAREYPIAAVDLRRKVATFLEALKNPASDPLLASLELYKILLAPVAEDLKGAKAQTLMWSLNDVLRYVPIAALHDGKQYLVENYRNVVITPASIGRLKDKVDVSSSSIAGMGVSKDYDGLGGLAAVPEELKHIVRDAQVQGATGVIPGTMLLDDDFTETRMAGALGKHYPVVHIASHFVLQAGNETNSYLLLGGKDVGGKGYHLTLAELRDDPALTFDGTELLTLSACQTATSGTALNGREVDGLGITAQQKGAKAVLASLWSVADESTADLMADFYKQWLGTAGMTKAAALQAAQKRMLHGENSVVPSEIHGTPKLQATAKNGNAQFTHPYYWAPFILIGNWQ